MENIDYSWVIELHHTSWHFVTYNVGWSLKRWDVAVSYILEMIFERNVYKFREFIKDRTHKKNVLSLKLNLEGFIKKKLIYVNMRYEPVHDVGT